jgi:O-6-methylguanine DNA methyltransferase
MEQRFRYGNLGATVTYRGGGVTGIEITEVRGGEADWGAFLASSPAIDTSSLSPFERSVLEVVRKIPEGEVVTYGEVARRVGRPGAARAVGQALARNPFPLLIPCHRVVRSDGRLGGFSSGPERKRMLLQEEGVEVEGDRVERGYVSRRYLSGPAGGRVGR